MIAKVEMFTVALSQIAYQNSFSVRSSDQNILIALAMLVQSPMQNQEMLIRAKEKSLEPRASILAIAIGSVLVLGAGISYLRKQRSA